MSRPQNRSLRLSHPQVVCHSRRRGSTLLVVVALMGLLALLGVMFFTFAQQEEENAKNYHEAAKYIHDPELGPDVYFDWALRQLIIGPNVDERNSVLWGGHMSLLPNAYGNDAHPHSGSGIRMRQQASFDMSGNLTGLTPPFLDLDGDGVNDVDPDGNGIIDAPYAGRWDRDQNGIADALEMNRSPAAHLVVPGGGNPNIAFEFRGDFFPNPDVDYTYPDINNAFLAHSMWTLAVEDLNGNGVLDPGEPDLDGNGAVTATRRIRVIKPSFFRPELLQRVEGDHNGNGSLENEDANGDGLFDPATEDTNSNGFFDIEDFNGDGTADAIARLDPTWYWGAWSRSLTLRAHPDHFSIPPNPQTEPTLRRYLNDNDPADAAIISSLPGGSRGFPFSGRRDPNNQTIQYGMSNGAWTGYRPSSVAHQFDVDADNDGIFEAILLDLAFPAQERPSDGALYVPMFAMTIYDADGLLNLNATGNLAGDSGPSATYFGNSTGTAGSGPLGIAKLSRSLMGLSTYEINPQWGLDAVPKSGALRPWAEVDVAATQDYLSYFGRNPFGNSVLADRWELANMEYWWMNKGRVEYGGSLPQVHAGRLGEANRVWNVLQQAGASPPIGLNDISVPANWNMFPYPGVWNQDDNRNAGEGGSANTNNGQTLAFQHPLALSGSGRFTIANQPKAPNLAGSPGRWLAYNDLGLAAATNWSTYLGGILLPAASTKYGTQFAGPGVDGNFGTNDDVLMDDMLELTLEPRSLRRPYDEPFTPADSALLHLSKTDIDLTGTTSRVRDVMPGNINPNEATVEANDRRRRFTTTSWDRKQFGLPRILGPGADGAPGVAGFDDNRNGIADDPGELGWPGTDDLRAWEFNVDLDRDGLAEFPPEFSTTKQAPFLPNNAYYGFHQSRPWDTASYGSFTPQGTICVDPFRPQLRRLLEVEYSNRDQLRLQFKLSVNHILDVIRTQNNTGHPYYSPLEFRPLTPHATDGAAVTAIPVITAGNPVPPLPPQAWNSFSAEAVREFWARYDRQRLARDIYVLLYTLCGGDDVINLSSTAAAYPDPRQTREMAQFAVNLVDAMDRDRVMTVFEYDADLSNGWNLDDQASTADIPSPEREVVVGVEAQELTISESLWVTQDELTNDNTYTPFDESNPPTGGTGADAYHFTQVELRSVSPRNVQLAVPSVSTGTGSNSVWRLRWQDTTDVNAVQPVETSTHNITNGNGLFFRANGAAVDTVPAGGLFTIATTNWTDAGISDLYVNTDTDTDFELIAPRYGTTTAVANPIPGGTAPNSNLDLVHTASANRFVLGNGSTGDFLSHNYTPSTPPGGLGPVLVLERRANPDLPQLPVNVNPWVVVDYTRLQNRLFMTETGSVPMQSEVQTTLDTMQSMQRMDPLNANPNETATSSVGYVANSLMGNNLPFSGTFTEWQLQLDRDFGSIAELMTLPLRGPKFLTHDIRRFRDNPVTQNTATAGPFSAAARFLRTDYPQTTLSGALDNSATSFSVGDGSLLTTGSSVVIGSELMRVSTVSGNSLTVTRGTNPTAHGGGSSVITGNHWHRLFGFVEVPSRSHKQLGNPLEITRIPGKLNLNTIREPEVLAALIDDLELFTPPERDLDGDNAPTAGVDDYNGNGFFNYGLPGVAADDSSRDWWFDMLASRDGRQPQTFLTLPGMPEIVANNGSGEKVVIGGSRPFRDIGFAAPHNSGTAIDHTLLRAHPFGGGSGANALTTRRLFELGTEAESDAGSINDFVRQRVLSKIAGNTTTRSNAFFVFISVQFHEAWEDPATGAVRIGGQIDLNSDGRRDDGHRGFFILDRSTAEEAYDRRTGTFNWREIVKHRLTIH